MAEIEVYVRIRPFNKTQPTKQIKIESTDPSQIRLKNQNGKKLKQFRFNAVSNKKQTQMQFYSLCKVDKFVDRVLEGYHSTIFAYGQTGSGKTFTMEGFEYTNSENPKAIANVQQENINLGIIPRALRSLFEKINFKNNDKVYKVEVSFLQIYNQKIHDLLDLQNKEKQSGLKLRWNKYEQFIVDKLQSFPCNNLKESLAIYVKGVKNKIMCKHKLNVSSSRSHCIFIVKVESYGYQDPANITKTGSQKQQMTGTQGIHYKEAIQINKSLFTLRQVIMGLSQLNKNAKDGSSNKVAQTSHIPYRDSKLTSILKQSIGGDSYCMMIACLNPGDFYIDQTLQTLTYAVLASQISNIPVKNQDQRIKQIKKLQTQLTKVKQQLNCANQQIQKLTKLLQSKISEHNDQIIQNKTIINQKQKSTEKCETSHEVIEIVGKKQKQITSSKKNNLKSVQMCQQPQSKPMMKSIPRRNFKQSQRQLVQSMNMIKDLLQSNMSLRQTVQQFKLNIQKRQSELYEVMKENQLLRERWDMVGGVINDQIHTGQIKKQPKGQFYKLEELLSQKQAFLQKPYRINTPSSNKTFVSNNTIGSSYFSKQPEVKRKSKSIFKRDTLKSLYQKLM